MLHPKHECPNKNQTMDAKNDHFAPWMVSFDARNPPNHWRWTNWGEGGRVEFRLNAHALEDESGVCSPPLWRSNSPTQSPTGSVNPLSSRSYRLLPLSSAAQAIARGQWEMMEMVKSMPESSYELSLKDLVDAKHKFGSQEEEESMEAAEQISILPGGQKGNYDHKQNRNRRSEKRGNQLRWGDGFDQSHHGFLLKMVSPMSFGAKRRKKSSANGNNGRTVPLKVDYLDRSSKSFERGVSFSSYSEIGGGTTTGRSGSTSSSGSSAGSSRSNSISGRHGGRSPGCWSFLMFKRAGSEE